MSHFAMNGDFHLKAAIVRRHDLIAESGSHQQIRAGQLL